LDLGAPRFNRQSISYFSEGLKSAAEKALLAADRRFQSSLKKTRAEESIDRPKLAALRQVWFWDVFLTFAVGARDIVAAGAGKAARFRDWCDTVYQAAADAAGIDHYRPLVDAALRSSPQWRRFQKIHSEVIAAPAGDKEPQQATPTAEPLTFCEWLQKQMDDLGIRSPYELLKLGGPRQPTTKRALNGLPSRPSTEHKIVEAINTARKDKKLPPIQPPAKPGR
jgi:hypothetical protein